MIIKVKVITRARKPEIKLLQDGYLKVKVNAPAVNNQANRELVKILARYYQINRSAVKIIRGEHAREKIIEILLPD